MEYVERSRWYDGSKQQIELIFDYRYPRVGRVRDDLVFRMGENVKRIIPLSGVSDDSLATDVVVIGAGEGPSAIRATVSRRTQPRRIRKVLTIENEDISRLERARQIALFKSDQITRSQYLIDKIEIDIDHLNAPWGTFQQGDDIFVEGKMIYHEQKVSGYFRIVSYIVNRRTRRATLDIAPSASFSYGALEP